MDFELLNFWITKIKFNITDNVLYILLESCDIDIFNSCKFELSSDKKKILDFFGFDSTIDYDNLKPYNIYEYLCTSSVLLPQYITYCGFKGPHAKNTNHSKFNEYLLKRFPYDKTHSQYSIYNDIDKWKRYAIKYFNKNDDYELYKSNYNILNKLFEKKDKFVEKIKWNEYKKFICLHGILTIINWDDNKFNEEWDLYKKSLWGNNLSMIINRY